MCFSSNVQVPCAVNAIINVDNRIYRLLGKVHYESIPSTSYIILFRRHFRVKQFVVMLDSLHRYIL